MSFIIPPDTALTATLATQYLGVAIASMLYGVTCIQTFHYYRSNKGRSDRWMLKAIVAALLILDSTHQALILHVVYYYIVTNYGDPFALLNNLWSIATSILISALIASLVQSYLILRIWRLSKNKYIVAGCGALMLGYLSTTLAYAIKELTFTYVLVAESKLKPIATVGLCMSVATDVSIAVALSYYLHKSRTGFRRSDDVLTKLIISAVTTGALTTLVVIADLAAYLAAPNDTYVLCINFSTGKLYANCLLTSLNSRDYFSGALSDGSGVNSLPLSKVNTDPEMGRNPQARQLNFNLKTSMSSNPSTTVHGKPDDVMILAPQFSRSVVDLPPNDHKNPAI
ncbi:hypothetical protein FA95DRAFT_1607555 [Auriscalpium vulgare]|uniref:Uncharacterized protein n=1 Tax=Auriscalpium vulgare TaxID=40419 RepID=A0ACB8RN76_9AGAM|nr:hypothetical protein FA95DRAFT_1607555 [Auriscalpium vulgare]